MKKKTVRIYIDFGLDQIKIVAFPKETALLATYSQQLEIDDAYDWPLPKFALYLAELLVSDSNSFEQHYVA